jgi:hypothetical protein
VFANLQIQYGIMKERHSLQVYENIVQRETLGLERDEQAGNNKVSKPSFAFLCCDGVEDALFEGEWECICSLREEDFLKPLEDQHDYGRVMLIFFSSITKKIFIHI